MERTLLQLFALAASSLPFLPSCQPVKEYQKNKLNCSEMTPGNRKIEKEELNFQAP
jgi:hypothetical protein